jgi:hypothetical protein
MSLVIVTRISSDGRGRKSAATTLPFRDRMRVLSLTELAIFHAFQESEKNLILSEGIAAALTELKGAMRVHSPHESRMRFKSPRQKTYGV